MAYYNGKSWVSSIGSNSVGKNSAGGNQYILRNTSPSNKNYSNYGYSSLVSSNSQGSAPSKNQGITGYSGSSSSSSGGSSGGGSGRSGGSGKIVDKNDGETGYVPGSWDYSGLIDLYTDTLNRKAMDAYNRSMGLVDDYYNQAMENLQNNYDESVGILDRNNERNTASINADAESAMRQAYVNNMLSRRNLQQAMTAQGLNGGATETTRASMENNYGNARNAIDTTRNKNLADLMSQYQNNLAGLRQELNSGLNDLYNKRLDYSMQINSDLQDRLDSYAKDISDYITEMGESDDPMKALKAMYRVKDYSDILDKYNAGNAAAGIGGYSQDYLNALNNIAGNSAYFAMNPAEALNYYDPVSMQQAGLATGSTNYQKALAAQEALGATTPQARNTALNQYSNISSLQQILRQLGYNV